ncbi:Protein of unknown function (DUF3712) [Geosmithia morbida]|uniref:Uncharacterized protein n=1 Tax=Geosmithia morbida TaxID=1094350 RepID=A0A9P5D4B6_9HYPO|nr:Protein of unknown function (DUF3712) [Geosmithia morbida]KAF4123361.1 Protein of unknown function (DUF3712) [Geosmithia morbida]
MSDKGTVHEESNPQVPKPSKRARCARHCKRFWWVHLIIFCCITVLVVCLVIFVGVPKIAQSKVNDAKLRIQGVNVLDTQPQSFTMEINSTISTDGSIKAKLDPFKGEMYLADLGKDSTFATVNLPKTNANKHQSVNVSQHVNIADTKKFTTFNTWFVNNETMRVSIDGHTKVKPSGLSRKSKVHFKKTVEMNGLNNLKGTTVPVDTAVLSLTTDEDGNNFKGVAKIPNASVYTLDIGNITYSNYVGDVKVGNMTINNVFLRPGSNTVQFTASVNQARVVNLLQSDQYCKTQVIPFELVCEKVVNDGQELNYFRDALKYKRQVVDMEIGKIVEKTLGSSLGCGSS